MPSCLCSIHVGNLVRFKAATLVTDSATCSDLWSSPGWLPGAHNTADEPDFNWSIVLVQWQNTRLLFVPLALTWPMLAFKYPRPIWGPALLKIIQNQLFLAQSWRGAHKNRNILNYSLCCVETEKNEKPAFKWIFPIFLTVRLCELKYLIPMIHFATPPPPNVISKVTGKKNEKPAFKWIFPIFLTWRLCKLKYLISMVHSPPPSVISKVTDRQTWRSWQSLLAILLTRLKNYSFNAV
jgi:hypothetical protein